MKTISELRKEIVEDFLDSPDKSKEITEEFAKELAEAMHDIIDCMATLAQVVPDVVAQHGPINSVKKIKLALTHHKVKPKAGLVTACIQKLLLANITKAHAIEELLIACQNYELIINDLEEKLNVHAQDK
jgi:hypothetical protein